MKIEETCESMLFTLADNRVAATPSSERSSVTSSSALSVIRLISPKDSNERDVLAARSRIF